MGQRQLLLLNVKASMWVNPMTLRVLASALALLFLVGYADAQSRATVGSAPSESPFAQLAGGWSGAGTIDLANGRH
jgi:hypothetical protein